MNPVSCEPETLEVSQRETLLREKIRSEVYLRTSWSRTSVTRIKDFFTNFLSLFLYFSLSYFFPPFSSSGHEEGGGEDVGRDGLRRSTSDRVVVDFVALY